MFLVGDIKNVFLDERILKGERGLESIAAFFLILRLPLLFLLRFKGFQNHLLNE